MCSQLGIDEHRARKWIEHYRAGDYTSAFDAGGSLSGTGGRPQASSGAGGRSQASSGAGGSKATVREQRAAKRKRQEATREDDVVVGSNDEGGIAARMRGRAQVGQR